MNEPASATMKQNTRRYWDVYVEDRLVLADESFAVAADTLDLVAFLDGHVRCDACRSRAFLAPKLGRATMAKPCMHPDHPDYSNDDPTWGEPRHADDGQCVGCGAEGYVLDQAGRCHACWQLEREEEERQDAARCAEIGEGDA